MGSSRLPAKMMLNLHGHPIIEWAFRRSGRSRRIDGLVVAVPDTDQDQPLAEFLTQAGACVFRGSEMDVLDRFYQAACEYQASHVIRICADNPLICPEEIDHLVEYFFHNNCDYAYNHIPRNNKYPDGLGAEMTAMTLLKKIQRKALVDSQREHVFNYIWDNLQDFNVKTFDPPDSFIQHPELKLDIDTLADYNKFLRLPLHIDMGAREVVKLFKEIS